MRVGRVRVWQRPPAVVIWQGFWIPPILNPIRLVAVLIGVSAVFYPLLWVPLVGSFLWVLFVVPFWLLVMIRWTVSEAKQRGWSIAIVDKR